jgi:hypothetical protein
MVVETNDGESAEENELIEVKQAEVKHTIEQMRIAKIKPVTSIEQPVGGSPVTVCCSQLP